jgi:hypothetical protein
LRNPTHYVVVPVESEERQGNPNLPAYKLSDALALFEKLGTVVDGPWFLKYLDGNQIMNNGKIVQGPALIYYAEVTNAQSTASNSTEE